VAVDSEAAAAPFEDLGEIGRGGMGAVHAVVDRRLLRTMARKALADQRRHDRAAVRRFVEEAQITGQLDHPNIVPVHQLGCDAAGQLFFTMKLVRGKTLATLLRELGAERLAPEHLDRLVGVVLKVCDALAFAHSRGVVHRDLKPSNVMVGSHGQVYVVDWGIAYVGGEARDNDPEADQLLGSPPYMAPEQVRGLGIDERTDVYGVGGLLYTILTGKPPHVGDSSLSYIYDAVTGPVSAPAERCTDALLPPELCRIAMRALAKDPVERYPSIDALQVEIEQFQRGGGWLATRRFVAGELLIREGDPAEEAYVITTGTCEAFKTIAGERVSLRRMGPGEVVGEASLLSSRERTASVAALEDLTVRVVTRHSLERELAGNTWLRSLFRGLAERFRDVDATLTDKLEG
jgi:serine/threonine-protein kinase